MIQPEVEQAVAFYKQGYTCAQSILASFAARFDLQQNLAFRIGEPFGAGISYGRHVRFSDRSNHGARFAIWIHP